MRIATFNVQNLRLRQSEGIDLLDAAQDRSKDDLDPTSRDQRVRDRQLTAKVIAKCDADLLMLQEVFDQRTLDFFHDRFLTPLGVAYPYRVCREGNDGRSEDLAVLSRLPLQQIVSHAAMTYDEIGCSPPEGATGASRVFRRDCLAVLCNSIWFFGCHFKVAYTGSPRDRAVRRAEALAVRRIVESELRRSFEADWLILGDFNIHDKDDEEDLQTLLETFSVDLTRDMTISERWTYRHPESGAKSCPDRILSAPVLKQHKVKTSPTAIRIGMAEMNGIPDMTIRSPRASDHALLWVDII